jgi:hypothetical protein
MNKNEEHRDEEDSNLDMIEEESQNSNDDDKLLNT